MRRALGLFLLCGATCALTPICAEAQSNPGLNLQVVATTPPGVTTVVASAPGDNSRLFIVLQDGRILIKDAGGLRPTPFLDLTGQVATGGEQGLLGLAFHPNYASNRLFYLHYVNLAGSVVVARYARSLADANVADPASGAVLLTIGHPYANHNGGQLAFGPDGYLYIASGDGGSAWDPNNNGQRLNTMLGKILRIDVNGGAPYAIPPNNPFASTPGAAREIWAWGLRNPWRFSFDRQTGDLFIGDVGQDYFEEIDFQAAGSPGGLNYGWRRIEGSRCVDPNNPYAEPPPACNTSGLTPPILEYSHDVGCSVTGGYRYRGTAIPGLNGFYLFGDYCCGIVWASRPDAGGAWVFAPVMQTSSLITTFGQDNAGRLYLGDGGGTVSKIVAGTPGLSVSDAGRLYEGNAGSRQAVFTVFLLPASTDAVTVAYATVSDTATADVDFTHTSGTLTFPPGTTSATISVPVLGDTQYEPDESFSLSLGSATNASVLEVGAAGRARIINDDSGLSIADLAASEGNAGTHNAVFTVTLTRPLGVSNTATVDYATADGTAIADSDYVPTAGTLTFAPGVTTATLSVPLIGDLLVEPAETFSVALSGASGASIVRGTATGTISNDDSGPLISLDDVTVPEGDSGTVDAVFTVTLERASEQVVTVHYRTYGSQAFPFPPYPDFVDTAGVLTFQPGITAQTVVVSVLGDLLDEADEQFGLALDAPVNGRINPAASGHATILDDDSPPVASLSGAPVVIEGDSGKRAARFTVDLSAPSGRVVQVPFRTIPGTATEGMEIFPVGTPQIVAWNGQAAHIYPAMLTVAPFTGSLRRVHVTLNLQRTIESPFEPGLIADLDVLLVSPLGLKVMLMSDVAADFGSATNVSLTFDDLAPFLVSGPLDSGTYRPTNWDPEGDSDVMPAPAPPGPYGSSISAFNGADPTGQWKVFVRGDAAFTNGAVFTSLVIQVETEADYLRSSEWAGFVPGATTRSVDVQVLGDRVVEPDEAFGAEIYSPMNAGLGASHASAAIVDDDQPALLIGDVEVPLGANATQAQFAVILDQPGLQPASVTYATSDGSAVAGTDYLATSGTIEFEPGATTQTLAVAVEANPSPGLNKTFILSLSDAAGATIRRGEGVATLVPPPPTLAVADASVPEGNYGARPIDFEVTLSAPTSRPVSVAYSTADGNATAAGQDYVPATGSVNFPVGSTSQRISVEIPGDAAPEQDESLLLQLSNPLGAFLGDGQAVGTLVNDDAAQRFQFKALSYSGAEGQAATIVVQRSGDIQGSATVAYATEDGSATGSGPQQDYSPASGVLNFAPNKNSASFSIQLLQDQTTEPDETVLLRLSSPQAPAGAALGHPAASALMIRNDDFGGTVQFAAPQLAVSESAGVLRVPVKRTGGTAAGSRVRFGTAPQTATGGDTDYSDLSGELTFAASGPLSKSLTIEVPIKQDAQAEGAETFTITLSEPGNGVTLGSPSLVNVSILDDEPTLEFGAVSYEIRESKPSARLEVSRSGVGSGPVSVSFATGAPGDSAMPGEDYKAVSGTLTLAAHVNKATISVPLLADSLVEDTETFSVVLSSPLGANLGAGNLTHVALIDDDALQTVEFASAEFTVKESAPEATLTFERTGNTECTLLADILVKTPDYGDAANWGDYKLYFGTFAYFNAGARTTTARVFILQDGLEEGTEDAVFELANPRCSDPSVAAAVLGPQRTATLHILDDETTLQFSAASYSQLEGKNVIVTLKRTGDKNRTSSVQYFASGGSAQGSGPGADYALPPRLVTFAPGQGTKTFSIPLLSDAAVEGDEELHIWLQGISGAGYGTPTEAVVTIHDDDAAGKAQFSSDAFVTDEAAGGAVVSVLRSGGAGGPVTVQYRAGLGSAGTPASASDFDAVSGVLTFGPSEVAKTFWVPLHPNGIADSGAASVSLWLESPSPGLTLGPLAEATLWILRE